MEKATPKTRSSLPALLDSSWMEKFLNAPLDEFFNFGKVMNVPAANVSETEKEFRLTIAAPGLEKSDFRIEATEDLVTVSAEKTKEERITGRFNRREYNYTSWSRSFSLPENCKYEEIHAEYKNGELSILIPKVEVREPKRLKKVQVS